MRFRIDGWQAGRNTGRPTCTVERIQVNVPWTGTFPAVSGSASHCPSRQSACSTTVAGVKEPGVRVWSRPHTQPESPSLRTFLNPLNRNNYTYFPPLCQAQTPLLIARTDAQPCSDMFARADIRCEEPPPEQQTAPLPQFRVCSSPNDGQPCAASGLRARLAVSPAETPAKVQGHLWGELPSLSAGFQGTSAFSHVPRISTVAAETISRRR